MTKISSGNYSAHCPGGTIQVQGTKVGMWEYIKSVQEKTDFYEKYYVNPAKTKLDFPSSKKKFDLYIYGINGK